MLATHAKLYFVLALVCVVTPLMSSGCTSKTAEPAPAAKIAPHPPGTSAIDLFDEELNRITGELRGEARDAARQSLYARRWLAVQNAVAHHGVTHRDAYFASRSYWHTGSTRGVGWALDHVGDLEEPFYIASRGNVRVQGDANADIEIAGNATVHILGDLDATLELRGICEVIVAGNLTKNATIICDGQLELFVAGNSRGILGSTGSSTLVIDGDAAGTIQSGAPATVLTVTGDLFADIPPPKNKDTILTLRVDGFAPSAALQTLANAGFTRVNATLKTSDTPPGLYPLDPQAARPAARWVVLEQRRDDSSNAD